MEFVTVDQLQHDVLRQIAQKLIFPLSSEAKSVITAMEKLIHDLDASGAPAGLAAPQVGYPLQIIFIQIPPEVLTFRKDALEAVPLTVLINPSYTPIGNDKYKDWEGCYSVPNKMGEVYRYYAIKYEAYTPEGEKISKKAEGLLARIIQHEVGHINGELYTDLITDDCRFGTVEELMPIRRAELIEKNWS